MLYCIPCCSLPLLLPCLPALPMPWSAPCSTASWTEMNKEKGRAKKEERKNKGNKKQKKEKSGSGRSRASKFCVSAKVAKEGNATPIGQQILLLQCVSPVVSSRTGLFCSHCSSSQLSHANGNEATSSIQNPRSKVRRKPWFMSNGVKRKETKANVQLRPVVVRLRMVYNGILTPPATPQFNVTYTSLQARWTEAPYNNTDFEGCGESRPCGA